MDRRSIELLELDAVRERWAGHAGFEGGAALARAYEPATDPAAVARAVAETEEAILLRDLGLAGPGGAHEVRPITADGARGLLLEPDLLARVLATVGVALELRTAVRELADQAPLLSDRIGVIMVPALRRVESALLRALDPHGGVADSASAELANVRRRIVHARRDSADLLRRLAVSLRSHLQEGFTTERAGRPVLAVKASSRSAVPGIVHDTSGSGNTIFVEPLALVEANNRVRELVIEEAEEVARILRMLTELIAEERAHLDVAAEELAHLDMRLAAAALSRAWDGTRVEPADEVDLRAARHPLLDRRTAVPVDLPLGEVRALVVSGPNTGGKTVALKTLGLLSMLHQCGLRVPARQARLPVFDQVLADIGDAQSIAESLSTFSAHVRRLIAILERAGAKSLVLLDEPAAGTDPDEGARLAEAVIAHLVGRGALVLATTHHPEVKEWAASAPMAMNASVGVDTERLRPLYTLALGQPGASHALGIAERLGLDSAIIAAAREAGTAGRRELEALLAEAATARAGAEREREDARRLRAEVAQEGERLRQRQSELDRRLERSAQQAAAARDAARREVEAELAQATRELAGLRREIAAARREETARVAEGRSAPGGVLSADRRSRERDRRLGAASERARSAQRAMSTPQPPQPDAEIGPAPTVGDSVVDTFTGARGVVVDLRGGRAEVQGATARMRVPVERLRVDRAAVAAVRREPPRPSAPTTPAVGIDLDVRGQRVEETRSQLRRHIDNAAVTGIDELRVIHGHGTGALRSVVREELGRHPLVGRVEPAPPELGGDGATLVYLGP